MPQGDRESPVIGRQGSLEFCLLNRVQGCELSRDFFVTHLLLKSTFILPSGTIFEIEDAKVVCMNPHPLCSPEERNKAH